MSCFVLYSAVRYCSLLPYWRRYLTYIASCMVAYKQKKIDSAITEQAITIAIVLNHVEKIIKPSALTENATECLCSRQDKIAVPLHEARRTLNFRSHLLESPLLFV